ALLVRGRPVRLHYFIPIAALLLLVVAFGVWRFLWPRTTAPQTLAAGELLELRQRSLAVLKAELRMPSKDLRRDALAALGESREIGLYPALKDMLKDADPEVQAEAAEALGKLGERQAIPALLQAVEQGQTAPLRIAAAHALQQLGAEEG